MQTAQQARRGADAGREGARHGGHGTQAGGVSGVHRTTGLARRVGTTLAVLGALWLMGLGTGAEARCPHESGLSGGGWRQYIERGGYQYRPGFGWGYWRGGHLFRGHPGWSRGDDLGASSIVGASSGLLFLLVTAGITYMAVVMGRRRRPMGRPVGYDPFGGVVYQMEAPEDPVQVIKAQLGLLATARHLQQDLERVASRGDTSTPEGLTHLLRETAIMLIREGAYWKAGFVGQETFEVPEEAERRFEEAVVGERVKLDSESLLSDRGRAARPGLAADAHKVGRYMVVTVLVAVSGPILDDNHTPSSEEMKQALTRLATIPAADLRALEVIWAPADPGGALDEDDVLMKYPGLSTF